MDAADSTDDRYWEEKGSTTDADAVVALRTTRPSSAERGTRADVTKRRRLASNKKPGFEEEEEREDALVVDLALCSPFICPSSSSSSSSSSSYPRLKPVPLSSMSAPSMSWTSASLLLLAVATPTRPAVRSSRSRGAGGRGGEGIASSARAMSATIRCWAEENEWESTVAACDVKEGRKNTSKMLSRRPSTIEHAATH